VGRGVPASDEVSVLSEKAIQDRLTAAMRARSAGETMVLRSLVAAIKNLKIERRGVTSGSPTELDEADLTQLVRREIKQREEAIVFAEQASRPDLVSKNREEKTFLETFLPQGLSSSELDDAITKHHAAGSRNIGALMGKLKSEFGARLDGKLASERIKQFLSSQEAS
jgi:uncharacterized protein